MITCDTIIFVSWMAFLLVWGISAFFVKRDIRGGGFGALWQRHWALRLAAAAIIILAAVRLGRRAGSGGSSLLSWHLHTTPGSRLDRCHTYRSRYRLCDLGAREPRA